MYVCMIDSSPTSEGSRRELDESLSKRVFYPKRCCVDVPRSDAPSVELVGIPADIHPLLSLITRGEWY